MATYTYYCFAMSNRTSTYLFLFGHDICLVYGSQVSAKLCVNPFCLQIIIESISLYEQKIALYSGWNYFFPLLSLLRALITYGYLLAFSKHISVIMAIKKESPRDDDKVL